MTTKSKTTRSKGQDSRLKKQVERSRTDALNVISTAKKRVTAPKKASPTAAETKRFLKALEDVEAFKTKYNQ